MTTAPVPPFAYGHEGAHLVTSDGPDLLVHAGSDEAPQWKHTMSATVVGVGVTGEAIVAVDAAGAFVACDRHLGEVVRTIALERLATGLAVARGGVVAVLGASSVNLVRAHGEEMRREIDVPGASAVAVDADGRRVAVGTRDGAVRVFDVASGEERGSSRVPAPVKGLCWSPRGYWLAATASGIARVGAGGQDTQRLVGTDDLELGSLTCSEEGALLAVRVGTTKVAIFDLLDGKVQGVVEYERTVGQVDFGPGATLGIGLDLGDGNKVDLLTGAVSRTDPHPGRKRNSWVLMCDPKTDQIARVLERAGNPGAFSRMEGAKRAATKPVAVSSPAPEGGINWVALIAIIVFAIGILLKLFSR
jgi:hypothetical protein